MSSKTIRNATPADRKAILELNTQAFKRPNESRIIEKLEKGGDILLELVAEEGGKIIGHIIFYPVGVRGRLGAVGLGPMSVHPKMQRKGIGSDLVNLGLETVQQSGAPIVFVLGHADYYPRFGFSVPLTKDFETPVKGPSFMALRFRHGPPMSGKLIFPEAFGIATSA